MVKSTVQKTCWSFKHLCDSERQILSVSPQFVIYIQISSRDDGKAVMQSSMSTGAG